MNWNLTCANAGKSDNRTCGFGRSSLRNYTAFHGPEWLQDQLILCLPIWLLDSRLPGQPFLSVLPRYSLVEPRFFRESGTIAEEENYEQ